MTEASPTHSLHLDERQRAMLKAMGVTVWWPTPAPSATEPALEGVGQGAGAGGGAGAGASESPSPIQHTTPNENFIAEKHYLESDRAQKSFKKSPDEHPGAHPSHAKSHPPSPTAPLAAPGTSTPALSTLSWEALQATLGQCQACGLCQGRTQTVVGAGPLPSRWMVVLDAPSEQEDRLGQPGAEPDGPLLRAMLAAMGLDSTADVFITHAVKCRGGAGRNPSPDELAACRPYLLRQLELVQPAMVLALGRLAAQSLLASEWPDVAQLPLGKLRGQVHTVAGVPVVVSYPPQSLLRHPADKAKAWNDLCLAMTHVSHSPLLG